MHDDFGARAFRYRKHFALLCLLHSQIAAQARARPRLRVPAETLRLVRRHLYEARKFRAGCGATSRALPTIPGGPLRFATLAMLLAMTRAEYRTFGRAFAYHADPEAKPRRARARRTEPVG